MNYTFKNSARILSVLLLLAVLIPSFAFAVDPPGTPDASRQSGGAADDSKQPAAKLISLQNPLKVDSIGGLIQSFVEIFSYIVILGAVLALIWVGLQFILARGNPAKMVELKNWLLWIVVGVAVVIGARLIIQVVINTLSASGAVDSRTIQSVQKAVDGN